MDLKGLFFVGSNFEVQELIRHVHGPICRDPERILLLWSFKKNIYTWCMHQKGHFEQGSYNPELGPELECITDCFFDMGMLGSNFEVRKLIWHVHGSVCIAPHVRIMLEIWKSSSVLNLHILTTYIYIYISIYDLYFYKYIVDTILLVCSYRYIIFASIYSLRTILF